MFASNWSKGTGVTYPASIRSVQRDTAHITHIYIDRTNNEGEIKTIEIACNDADLFDLIGRLQLSIKGAQDNETISN